MIQLGDDNMGYTLDKKIYFINIFTLLLISSIIIYLLYINLHNQKKAAINDAQNKTETLAQFIKSDIERLLFGVEELMEGIHLAEEHISNNPHHDNEIQKLLLKNMRPYIMDILIVNKNAEIIHWTGKGTPPSIKDREYATFHIDQAFSANTFIGVPKLSKVHKNRWFFAASKAFYKKNRLEHIIVTILDMSFFNQRYKDNLINKNSTIFIGARNGQIYARYPYKKEYIGKQVKEIKAFVDLNINKKTYDIPSPLDNKERIATLVQSNKYHIVSGVSVLTKDILKPWYHQRTMTILISFIISLGFLILIYYYTHLQRKLIKLSQIDPLTELFNRGYFTKHATIEFNRAKRFSEPLSIIMVDIDNFKIINDTQGHQIGDQVIQKLSEDITFSIRTIDIAARYGGEEFIILLPNTKEAEAKQVAQRIRQKFGSALNKKEFIATASFGLAQLKKDDQSIDDTIKRADQALYLSKKEGKNTIRSF